LFHVISVSDQFGLVVLETFTVGVVPPEAKQVKINVALIIFWKDGIRDKLNKLFALNMEVERLSTYKSVEVPKLLFASEFCT
jgi:hypothetical protein